MNMIVRSLPLMLALPVLHAHAQSVSPVWDAYMERPAAEAAGAQPAPPASSAPPAPTIEQPAPAPERPASGPGTAPDGGAGFFIAVQAGKGWLHDDADQNARAVSAGYRWDAADFRSSGGVEVGIGMLDDTSDRDYLYPEIRLFTLGGTGRFNFGDSRWFGVVRGGYFNARQDSVDGGDDTIDGGYLGLGVGVDVSRRFNISLAYTAYFYGTSYYYFGYGPGPGYGGIYEADVNHADMLTIGAEARF